MVHLVRMSGCSAAIVGDPGIEVFVSWRSDLEGFESQFSGDVSLDSAVHSRVIPSGMMRQLFQEQLCS